ncbi:MAG TPA: O-antigen ligase family protein [Rhizomicrobium sp.]|jgi:O-antigen ligase|nr:O-antigen ligase family protein [Rhizomicrobium sp.]
MTNIPSYTAPSAALPRLAPWLAETAFLALLLMVFVGLAPFAPRDPATLAIGESGFAGAGDAVRQILYLIVLLTTVGAALELRGLAAFRTVSPVFALLLGWCLLSAWWAPEEGVALRRAGLEVVIVLSAMLGVESIGVERALRLLRYVLIFVLVVNWISIPLIHNAVHLPGESDPSLVGDWRGLYFHKNIAGAVSALSAIVFFFFALQTKSKADWALFAAAVGFTVMTRSKSSIGLLPVALAMAWVYRAAWNRGMDRAIILLSMALVAVLAVTFAIVDAGAIARVFEDPTQFTGRTAIWQAEIAFLHDHPFFGAGFGSFADTGALSPLHGYVGEAWVTTEAHGHNAYLQVLVTIGGIGFVLAMIAFIAEPLVRFFRARREDLPLYTLLFAVFVFMILHNFLESDFLEGDGPAWVVFLLMLAMLRRAPEAA